jgi:hypothetical protein
MFALRYSKTHDRLLAYLMFDYHLLGSYKKTMTRHLRLAHQ